MELQFNELSIKSFANKFDANEKVKQFAQTAAEARKKGFLNIRSDYATNQIVLSENYSLYDCLNSKEFPREYKDFLYGIIVIPFIKDEDAEIADNYILANYYFEDAENGFEKTKCTGLASAYLYDTLSISLSTHDIWNNHKLQIQIEKNGCLSKEFVFNVSSKETFNIQEIVDYIDNRVNISIVETSLKPNDKNIHLADHHGKAELQELCKQLRHSPYVEEMRSTNWGGNKFIRKIQKDGIIEIVLLNTERKYALQVQTTGKNYRETEAIAKILEEKYT